MPTIIHDIDAANQSLGRIATRISVLLRGKDRADYEPRSMPDVKVVVHNLSGIVFKGTKLTATRFYRHSGYPGSIRSRSLAEEWERSPVAVLRHAVRGMLPPNRTRDRLLKNIVIK